AHAQFVSNLVDYGMNIQGALEAPRFTVASGQVSCDILIESRVAPDVIRVLQQKGHNLMVRSEYTATMGRGQAVLHNSKTGMNWAASDPRADGVAEPEPMH
ncbi:MAG TPA: gamma-glutamyltransferase, partial [Candidatus Angelobacter sp.]|nr:gamma-glutamyltransferase [Candidatus Angelobacter sp.]